MLGIEARGFIFAAPVAYRLGAGFVPVRKAGKLPWEIEREEYALEYGTDLLEIHRDAIAAGRAGADRRRRAGHRRHRLGHRPAGRAAGRRGGRVRRSWSSWASSGGRAKLDGYDVSLLAR